MAFKQTGTTSFSVDDEARAFGFVVTVSDKKLRMRVEDSVTREQWRTSELGVDDFVTAETAIPQAKLEHYAARITACLLPASDDAKATRSLSEAAEDGSRVLRVGFTMEPLGFPAVIEYSFQLEAVQVEPMEALKARVRDLERTVEAMKEERGGRCSTSITKPKVERPEMSATFATVVDTSRGNALEWVSMEEIDEGAFVVDDETTVVVVQGGTYLISLSVLTEARKSARVATIELNGEVVYKLSGDEDEDDDNDGGDENEFILSGDEDEDDGNDGGDENEELSLTTATVKATIPNNGRLQVVLGAHLAYSDCSMAITRI